MNSKNYQEQQNTFYPQNTISNFANHFYFCIIFASERSLDKQAIPFVVLQFTWRRIYNSKRIIVWNTKYDIDVANIATHGNEKEIIEVIIPLHDRNLLKEIARKLGWTRIL